MCTENIDFVAGHAAQFSYWVLGNLDSVWARIVHFYSVIPEKAMAPHSSTLAWKIPWTEGPGGLQSMGLLGVGHDWATSLSLFTSMLWRRKWQPTPVFLPGESQGWGSLVGCVYGVAQSRTRLTWLSSSSHVLPVLLISERCQHLTSVERRAKSLRAKIWNRSKALVKKAWLKECLA